jgi:glucosyl-3-phosphoglycerate synthase
VAFPHPETPRFEHPPPAEAMFDHGDFDRAELVDHKGDTTVSVVLPARNEEATVATIVATIRDRLVDEHPLVDELLVIDDGSIDGTADRAAAAGAKVVAADTVLPEYGSGGKGEALWKSLRASTGDLVVWCDADIRNFSERFVVGCLGPLLTRPDVGFVKGFYRRPLNEDGEGGGRVTELVARPLIATLFPELGAMVQPLSGEFGGRRELLEAVPFHRGYAVDLGLLVDLSRRFGVERLAQVDLGARVHRNRPLRELGPQAAAIVAMALERSGLREVEDLEHLIMARPEFGDADITVGHLPPMATVRA